MRVRLFQPHMDIKENIRVGELPLAGGHMHSGEEAGKTERTESENNQKLVLHLK